LVEYDRVINAANVQVFGDVPGEVYMWCFRKENREANLRVIVSKTDETVSVEDYLYKVE
jgi:hypothetical protein